MPRRKGMMVGKGKKGYHNVVPKDKVVHSQSAKGIKQPQRINISRNRLRGKYQINVENFGQVLTEVTAYAEALREEGFADAEKEEVENLYHLVVDDGIAKKCYCSEDNAPCGYCEAQFDV